MKRLIGTVLVTLSLTALAAPVVAGDGRGGGDGRGDGCRRQDTPNVIIGTSQPDRLPGTECDDIIFGFGGNDTIIGDEGEDVLLGGGGRDRINSRDGEADSVRGGRRLDVCIGDDLDTFSCCEVVLLP